MENYRCVFLSLFPFKNYRTREVAWRWLMWNFHFISNKTLFKNSTGFLLKIFFWSSQSKFVWNIAFSTIPKSLDLNLQTHIQINFLFFHQTDEPRITKSEQWAHTIAMIAFGKFTKYFGMFYVKQLTLSEHILNSTSLGFRFYTTTTTITITTTTHVH